MSAAFSSSAEDVIVKVVDAPTPQFRLTADEIKKAYELDACTKWILENGFTRIALQFPDRLLRYSASVCQALESLTSKKFFILGDTTYGSCCVDEIAAEHASCDSIIHFGPSCLSPSSRLPVALVFPRSFEFDFIGFHLKLSSLESSSRKYFLIFDTDCLNIAVDLKTRLPAEFEFSKFVIPEGQTVLSAEDVSEFIIDEKSSHDNPGNTFNQRFIPFSSNTSTEPPNFIFIGTSGPCMINLCLQLPNGSFYHYDPVEKSLILQSAQINRRIMRRNYLIEQAKDARIVGILVGTLGVKGYLGIIERLKSVIKAAGKRFYTFVMGKPNPAKLANFMEVDVFVYISCAESYFDSKEYLRPIVTPHEMEIACTQREITEGFIADFRDLLPGGKAFVELDSSFEVQPDSSLIHGKSRFVEMTKENIQLQSTDLILRDQLLTVSTQVASAGDFLANRSWKGLEPEYGMNEPAEIVEGLHGIALSYENENVGKRECGRGCCQKQSGTCQIESGENSNCLDGN